MSDADVESFSLRSKRFLGVCEQRKTEKRDSRCFGICLLGKWGESQRKKDRVGAIFRAVIICSRTPKKRLLHRLDNFQNALV